MRTVFMRSLSGINDSQSECEAAGGCFLSIGDPGAAYTFCVTPDYCEENNGWWDARSRSCLWADGQVTSCDRSTGGNGNGNSNDGHWYDSLWEYFQNLFGGGQPAPTPAPANQYPTTQPQQTNWLPIIAIGGVAIVAVILLTGSSGGYRRRNPAVRKKRNSPLLEYYVFPSLYQIAQQDELKKQTELERRRKKRKHA